MPLGLNTAISTACFKAFWARIIYEIDYCLSSAKQQCESILLDSTIVRDSIVTELSNNRFYECSGGVNKRLQRLMSFFGGGNSIVFTVINPDSNGTLSGGLMQGSM